MAYLKMRCIYIFLLLLGAMCLIFSKYHLKKEQFSFKIKRGNFLQLPEVDCVQNPPFLVILVTSSHRQVAARLAIRNAWGKEKVVKGKLIKTFFLLGTTSNQQETTIVVKEGIQYRDIIQKDFVDVYFNLTLKTMMGMEWVHHFCPQATFVMKTDSDMFVNVYYLTELLLKKNRTTRFFTGFLKSNSHPIRHKSSKWFISKQEYPWNTYPPFCSGTGYVFSSDVASQVYNVSKSTQFIKFEDVFVGLCLAKLNIKPQELHSEETFFPGRMPFSKCRFKKIVTSHYMKPSEISLYWDALENSLEEKCPDTQEALRALLEKIMHPKSL
ncbi:PREDICTED: beta-1,3-galactosyltransferase 5-like [Elephantulus edwardii]|uniref:beta-1,3-galactosyltransferase 5-like n=1 Tax=Elephantulus edwardii TaxID=28737 RepID=UPI0003F0B4AA|nr:PREDICTED: beta-1,3-galactosyltransferase 5-like [Elephantulus edwardii]